MLNQETAKAARTDSGYILRAPRRMRVADAVAQYMRVNNALWRDSPGPGYVHFPDWLGSWFYDELTYEERSSDGKWSKPGRGANEAFDLMVYAEALVILHGYEKIRWPDAPEWASRETWLECVPDSTEPSPSPEPVSTPVKKQKRKKTVTDDVNPWLTSGGWL